MADNNKKHIIVCGKGGGSGTQVQADWNETDSTSPAYINNKPTGLSNEWWGTQAEYDLIDPKDPDTVYHIEGSEAVDWDDITDKPTFAAVATSGDYTDLSNTPSIPAAQVNSDWNAVSGVAEILNKPSLATVATTGNYSDLNGTPTIPAAPVQSDWNEADSGSLAYINNKPTIPAAQVQSDWNANSGMGEILNKPSTETLTFTLADQSTVTLDVYVATILP